MGKNAPNASSVTQLGASLLRWGHQHRGRHCIWSSPKRKRSGLRFRSLPLLVRFLMLVLVLVLVLLLVLLLAPLLVLFLVLLLRGATRWRYSWGYSGATQANTHATKNERRRRIICDPATRGLPRAVTQIIHNEFARDSGPPSE